MNSSATLSWETISTQLKQKVTPDTFSRWFSCLRLLQIDSENIILGVPNPIYQFFIEDNYLQPLKETLLEMTQRPLNIRFQITPSLSSDNKMEEIPPKPIPTEEELVTASNEASDRCGLNPRYTFEAFVVGSSNELSHAAAKAVAASPGKTYNPLFIHGGVGLGKTHLMHAIGNAILKKKSSSKVCYVTSEQFVNEFITAIQNNTLPKFRKRYRFIDVLLIDDIQFLGGNKERSQEEFFHTFNSLFDGRKQIVLTCDRPAAEIASLEERLVSRFDWGLTAELLPPDVETRIAILRKKTESMGTDISDELLQFLATKIKNNVRRLEGALLRVAAYSSLSGKSLTLQTVESLLKDLLQEENRRSITVELIQKRVSEVFDLRPSDMTGKRRPAHIALPRQVAMYLSRKLTSHSLQEIGAAFGGRDHGTVLHAVKTVTEKMGKHDKIRQQVLFLENQLQRP